MEAAKETTGRKFLPPGFVLKRFEKQRLLRVMGMKSMFECVHPRPCGRFGNTQKAFTCARAVVTKYQKKNPGSWLDCTDIPIEVPRLDYEKLNAGVIGPFGRPMRVLLAIASADVGKYHLFGLAPFRLLLRPPRRSTSAWYPSLIALCAKTTPRIVTFFSQGTTDQSREKALAAQIPFIAQR